LRIKEEGKREDKVPAVVEHAILGTYPTTAPHEKDTFKNNNVRTHVFKRNTSLLEGMYENI
jgi:hypothetical protein